MFDSYLLESRDGIQKADMFWNRRRLLASPVTDEEHSRIIDDFGQTGSQGQFIDPLDVELLGAIEKIKRNQLVSKSINIRTSFIDPRKISSIG